MVEDEFAQRHRAGSSSTASTGKKRSRESLSDAQKIDKVYTHLDAIDQVSQLAKKSAEAINEITAKLDQADSEIEKQELMSIVTASSKCFNDINNHLDNSIKGISTALANTEALKSAAQAHRKSTASIRDRMTSRKK